MEKAAMDKPEFAASLAALAMVQGRYDEAVKHAGRVAATDPHNTAGHLALARAELARGRFEEAAGHALDALEITQAIPEAHHLLGAALAWYGDLPSAQQSIDTALQYDPDARESHRFAALLCALANDHEGSARHRARVAELSASVSHAASDPPFGPADFAVKNGLPPI